MTFDPYMVLGVDRSVDASSVKRAYRKKAKRAHPDGGGDDRVFSQLNRAYLVLSDPAKRSRYDRDGAVDDGPADNAISKAVSAVVGFFAAAVEQHVRSGAPDPLAVDLVGEARKAFKAEIAKYEAQKERLLKTRQMLENVEKRLRDRKVANPLLRRALLMQAQSAAVPLSTIESNVASYREAIALLDGYDYENDQAFLRKTFFGT